MNGTIPALLRKTVHNMRRHFLFDASQRSDVAGKGRAPQIYIKSLGVAKRVSHGLTPRRA